MFHYWSEFEIKTENKQFLKTGSSLVSQTDADPKLVLSFHENISVIALLEKSLLVSRYF